MSDFYAILKVQNGRIRKAMEDAGMKSVADLAKAAGYTHPGPVYDIVNFKASPLRNKDRKFRLVAIRVSDALGVFPDDLFPDHLCTTMESNQVAKYVERNALPSAGYRHLPSPIESAEEGEMKDRLKRVLRTLSRREQTVLRLRRGLDGERGHTLDECAEKLGVTRDRVRQIEAEAIRKLQHPVRAERLEGFLEWGER